MLRLLLLRHAKSSWDAPALHDRDRPLTVRGRRAARSMGEFMHKSGYRPHHVMCSPAARARATCTLVLQAMNRKVRCTIEEDIYDFGDGSVILRLIRAKGGGVSPLLLVGHNPSMEELAAALVGDGPPAAIKAMARKFPTAALAVIDFDAATWADIAEGAGRLVSFTRPKTLNG